MLFNSLSFLIFFPLVTAVYFALPSYPRKLFLLLASYIFYMVWNPAYVLVIILATGVDYIAGRQIADTPAPRRRHWLWASLAVNLGLLFFFKYFNFANDTLRNLLGLVDLANPIPALNIILPVGLSFHTFQAISYTVDVYQGRQPAERSLLNFALYIAFFPQLVAGPIERAGRLLPQFNIRHTFDSQRVTAGLQRMAWGFFMKVVIADRAAALALPVYHTPEAYSGWELLIATYLLTFMVYCDFAGYSEIALGAAQVLGISLMENFRRPYLASSVPEFWRRWHISLITWFTDYVYIPLGGSKVSRPRWAFNLWLIFLLSGLWHGANWTYVVWGGLNGLFLVLAVVWQNSGAGSAVARALHLTQHPRLHRLLGILVTYHLFIAAGVFFMAPTLPQALTILERLFSGGSTAFITPLWLRDMVPLAGWIVVLLMVESFQEFTSVRLSAQPVLVRRALQYALLLAILAFGVFDNRAFVYYQF